MKETRMSSAHDNLNIMSTKDILEKNVYDLQYQLTHANERVAHLADKLGNILAIHADLAYHLQGIEIYISDIKELLDESK